MAEQTATTTPPVQQSTNAEAGGDMLDVAANILRTAQKEEADQVALELKNKAVEVTTPAVTDTETDPEDEPVTASTVPAKEVPAAETVKDPKAEIVDDYKEFDEDDEPAVPGEGKSTPAAQENPELLSKAKEYDDLLSDPLISMVIAAKKAGKPIIPILEQAKPVDFSKLSAEDMIKLDCERMGITSEKEIEAEVDAFNSLTPRKQKEELSQLQSKLTADQNTRIEKIVSGVKEDTGKQAAIMNNFVTGVQTLAKDVIGKDFNGIKVDEKTAKEMEDYVLHNWGLFQSDGSINVKKAMSYAFWDLRGKKMLREHAKNSRNSGRQEILEDVHQPDRMNNASQNRPGEASGHTAEKLVSSFVGVE